MSCIKIIIGTAMKASKRTHKTGHKANAVRRAGTGRSASPRRPAKKIQTIHRHAHMHAASKQHPHTRKEAARKAVLDMKAIAQEKLEHVKSGEAAKKAAMGLPIASEAKEAIDSLMQNDRGISYLKKNVSRSITDVISLLTVARTDEYIAEKLGIKINAVRRMLNIMQNYGITNYYISKNKNGWLSFAWYMNTSKLPSFLEYVRGVESEKSMIEENCNDYFVCNNCYKENKLIFTFDAAYEAGFSCNACGKNLERLGGKSDVEKLVNESTLEANAASANEVISARLSPK
jgi:transcription factor E